MSRGHQHLTPLADGTRVRHYGQQFRRARTEGTADIVEHFWRGPWLEYRVQLDKPEYSGGPTVVEWSADTTIPITQIPHTSERERR